MSVICKRVEKFSGMIRRGKSALGHMLFNGLTQEKQINYNFVSTLQAYCLTWTD